MKIAILCAGPSLLDTYRGQEADVTVAVNAAAIHFEYDWLVYGDFVVHKWPIKRPRTGILTAKSIRRKALDGQFGEHWQEWHGVLEHREWGGFECLRHKVGPSYSFVAALAFACEDLRATEVVVYGNDQSGVGVAPGARDYGDDRWARERREIGYVTAYHKTRIIKGE